MEFPFSIEEGYIENKSLDMELGLERRATPDNLTELCAEYGIEKNLADEFLRRVVKEVLDYCNKHSMVGSNDLWPGIEHIYRFYLATRNEDSDLANGLSTLDKFWSKYGGNKYGVNVKNNFTDQRIRFFQHRMIHPQKIFEVLGERSRRWNCPVYNWQGDWRRINKLSDDYTAEYVENSVLEEVELILNSEGGWKTDYYHVSGSDALFAIGESGALMSARLLEELGKQPVTGEHIRRFDDKGKLMLVGNRGLGSVYASSDSPHFFGYATVDWFDKYMVAFGINDKKMASYCEEQNIDYDPREPYPGDGLAMGEKVPLNCIDFVYCNAIDMPKLQGWTEKYAPHAKVVSREAFEILNNSDFGKNLEDKKKWLEEIKKRPVTHLA